ncbi:MAG: hypothetical protein GXP62_21940 [Oligoflexia bacterium]|nr:hypothetical protein [Oligoflexia bacterium]
MPLLPWLLLPPLLPLQAAAAEPDQPQAVQTYALVVGSNRPGPGQVPLRFATDDATAMADVMVAAGGLEVDHLVRLDNPDADTLLATLDGFDDQLRAQNEAGHRTAFLFFYSGHARAQGLDLGEQTLSLADLRERLVGLDANLTLAVLDACQSGAVTDAKGVEPAADFSTSSVSGLSAEGFAVIASSSDTELSQESAELGGGVFTHHLTVGLRGAADADDDGAVTLDEAYQYAYDRTLLTTSATAIGAQHVTLETDLRGQGALVLTRPRAATARLRLSDDLDAELVIATVPQQRVVAEIHKAPGRGYELALAPGEYSALVRRGDQAERCTMTLTQGVTPLPTTGCEPVAVAQLAARGVVDDSAVSTVAPIATPKPKPLETFFMEYSAGIIRPHSDPYTDRLVDFGFGTAADADDINPVFNAAMSFGLSRFFSLVGGLGVLDHEKRSREVYATVGDRADETVKFRWTTWRAGLYARAQLPLLYDWIVPYGQAGGGVGWATTKYRNADEDTIREHQIGPQLSGALGIQIMPRLGHFRNFGLFWQTELVTAPVIENLLGDQHDSGGLIHQFGIRGGY